MSAMWKALCTGEYDQKNVCLLLKVSYRQVVLIFPKQFRIHFHNHSNKKRLYSGFMLLAEACLSEFIQAHFKIDSCEITGMVFIQTYSCNGNYPRIYM
ncbi:hypothetical protein [Candidatus Enterovibrio escicola]|uniref:hypothetical protein n=1 Tax=Candidatus Enterovibrio escicola TaxID=1927127 RepID=UPI0016808DD5|nr:hypothetical protein [Candidatus Enterovibrio escacola]